MKHSVKYLSFVFILLLLTILFVVFEPLQLLSPPRNPSTQRVLAQDSLDDATRTEPVDDGDDTSDDGYGGDIDTTDESIEAALSEITCVSDETKNTLLENPENITCLQVVNECVNTHIENRAPQMTELLENPSPTSDLLPIAIDFYRAMEDEAYFLFDIVFSIRRSSETHGEKIVEEFPACQNFLDQIYKDGMRSFLRDYLLENAQRKRSYILVDKYKQINSQLGNLNTMIAEWYGNITSFNQKLPALSKYCQ